MQADYYVYVQDVSLYMPTPRTQSLWYAMAQS